MENGKFFNYFLKKETLKKEIENSLFNSKYYTFTHKIQIGGSGADRLISYLHESIHFYLNNYLSLCIAGIDVANLFNYLKYFYVQKKNELIDADGRYKNLPNDEFKAMEFVLSHTEELDQIFSKDVKLKKYCEFCVDIFELYIELTDANAVINEGLATYYSLNADKDCQIFDYPFIPNIYKLAKEEGISYEDIKNKQNELRNYLLQIEDQDSLYYVSYKYTEVLAHYYGNDFLLNVLLKIISKPYDPYCYCLLNYDKTEEIQIVRDYYSYDQMFLNLTEKGEKILHILTKNNTEEIKIGKLTNLITNNAIPYIKPSMIELNEKIKINYYMHPKVVREIENLLDRSLTERDYILAMKFSHAQRNGSATFSFYEKDTLEKTSDLDMIDFIMKYKFGYNLLANKADLYAERGFESTYFGMKKIIDNFERREKA